MLQALDRLGLLEPGHPATGEPLTGGVSSEIWRIELGSRTVCAKRALSQLKVAQDWFAPIERAAQEAEFNRIAHAHWPERVPELIGFETSTGTLISEYLAPDRHPVWKTQLRKGATLPGFAAKVAEFLVALYGKTKGSQSVQTVFYRPGLIHALRLEPYFLSTAQVHADLAPMLGALVDLFTQNCISLIHGDFSPKNILAGPNGPIILDAECANFGDPAFDAAFCLNHLFLKAIWAPEHSQLYNASAHAFLTAYATGLPSSAILSRIAAYLPGLMLARIDGKSPVEYIRSDLDKKRVSRFARKHLQDPENDPWALIERWFGTPQPDPASEQQERT